MQRPPLALDIETVGEDWDGLDEPTQKYLITRASRRLPVDAGAGGAEALARECLGLAAGTGRIIVIGMANVASEQGALLYEGEGGWVKTQPGETRVFRGDERAMLAAFWQLLDSFGRVVTYNGRGFDLPYLYLRSALHGLRPGRQLLGNRYSVHVHCDLAEVLTLMGAAQERFSLDFWCRRFGLISPKEQGIDGSQVGTLYAQGRIDDIAAYCMRDTLATAQLYKRLEPSLIEMYEGRG